MVQGSVSVAPRKRFRFLSWKPKQFPQMQPANYQKHHISLRLTWKTVGGTLSLRFSHQPPVRLNSISPHSSSVLRSERKKRQESKKNFRQRSHNYSRRPISTM